MTRFPKSLIYGLEHRRLAAYEQKIAEQFDHSIFVSEKEAEIFTTQNPQIANVTVIPNGVDCEFFSPARRYKVQGLGSKEDSCKALNPEPCTLHPVLLFCGTMDYHANVDGVTWFCDKIYPEIKRSVPNAEFYIVGSNPNPKVRALQNSNGVKVIGFVEDIRLYYQVADVCVIPLRLARGVQNKVLEAMAVAKPVVTTSKAVQGINALDGLHLIVADDPKDFSKAVLTLLNDENQRRELGTKARQFVKTHYHWPTNMNKLEQLITDTN